MVKIDGLAELAAANKLPAGKWFEIRLRFTPKQDGTVDVVFLPAILPVSDDDVDDMRARKGGQLS